MRHRRQLGLIGLTGTMLLTLLTAASWACVPEDQAQKLAVSPRQAAPGQQVVVTARTTANNNPLAVHLNSAGGPLLGTIATDGLPPGTGAFSASLTIPPTALPGQNALIVVQEGATWAPAPVALVDATGVVPQVVRSQAVAPAADEGGARAAAGLAAGLLFLLALNSADFRRLARRRGLPDRVPLWHRLHPSALALLSGAAAYAAVRPELDGSLVIVGATALVAGLLSGLRLHFIPIGLVIGLWGLGVWLVAEGHLEGDRSSAVTVTSLGLGLLLCAKLARSPRQRQEWLYTGSLSAFNAGVSYYVMYDMPASLSRWPAFAISLAAWAVWEQFRAARYDRPAVAPAGGGAEPAQASPAPAGTEHEEPTLEPSPS